MVPVSSYFSTLIKLTNYIVVMILVAQNQVQPSAISSPNFIFQTTIPL